MKKYTVKDIMNKGPCKEYTKERVLELWAGKETLTFKEVCTLDIDSKDRTWIAARLASRDTVVSWANYCADEAQKHATNTNAVAHAAYAAAYYAAAGADYAVSATAAHAAAYAAAAADAATTYATYAAWVKIRNEELERLLFKLVEMHEAE